MSRLIGVTPDQVKPGMPVKICWEDLPNGARFYAFERDDLETQLEDSCALVIARLRYNVSPRHARGSGLPSRVAAMARSQPAALPARPRGAAAAGRDDAVVPQAVAKGLDRAALAEAARRHGRDAQPADHLHRGNGAHRRALSADAGAEQYRADPDRVWHRCAEGAPSAADPRRRRDLGAGLFRARRRLRSRQPHHQRHAQGRSFHRPRPEDLADLGAPCRLDVHAGAHRSAGAAAASRHQLPVDRPAQPGRARAADQDHRRR